MANFLFSYVLVYTFLVVSDVQHLMIAITDPNGLRTP
jgi:hypothetical protein